MLDEFLRHRQQVIRRRTEFLVREAKRRGHLLEGQLIAISSLEEVIKVCRNAPNRAEAKEQLKAMTVAASVLERALGSEPFAALQRELGVAETYQMTEQQADAVVNLRLGQLAALERDEIFKEYSELRKNINYYEDLLAHPEKILGLIREDLIAIRDKYGDDRKTEISDEGGSVDYEDLIPEEDVVVSLSHNGYIKRQSLGTYKAQHRGGKGVSGGVKDDDFVEHFFIASTHSYLLCFTNTGRLYWLKVYTIPEAKRTATGRSIANVLPLREDEKIASLIPVRTFEGGSSLLMATQNGVVKKTFLEKYSRPKQGGIIGINIDEGDRLVSVSLVNPGDEVVLSTSGGYAIRFRVNDVSNVGRDARGVRGIKPTPGATVIGMVVANPEGYLLTVCENGFGKRTPFGPNELEEPGDENPGAEVEQTTSSPARTRFPRRIRNPLISHQNHPCVTVDKIAAVKG
jgi:DNA gyrase subunit A